MYKKYRDTQGQVLENMIYNIETNSFIPFDPANTDYQAYLKWVEEGNAVLPADEPTNG